MWIFSTDFANYLIFRFFPRYLFCDWLLFWIKIKYFRRQKYERNAHRKKKSARFCYFTLFAIHFWWMEFLPFFFFCEPKPKRLNTLPSMHEQMNESMNQLFSGVLLMFCIFLFAFVGTSLTTSNMYWTYNSYAGSFRYRSGVLRSKLSRKLQSISTIDPYAT